MKITSKKPTLKKENRVTYPINKNKITFSSIKENWLERVHNFIKDSTTNKEEECFYWVFKKFMKKHPRNPNYGYDKQYYPSQNLMVKFDQLDTNTKRYNVAFKIYEKDYLFGLNIHQKSFKIDYIEKITKVKHEQLKLKINQSDWKQNIKNKKLLMLEANINQLKFYDSYNTIDRNNNMFHLLNLIVSLKVIFEKDIQTKINLKIWDFGNQKEILKKTDWEIIKQLDEINSVPNSKVENIWKKIKTLRNIWTHYYEYIINPCKQHKGDESCFCEITKRILLKIIFWKDDIYFLIFEYKDIGEENNYKIIKYDFLNIELILKNYLQDILI